MITFLRWKNQEWTTYIPESKHNATQWRSDGIRGSNRLNSCWGLPQVCTPRGRSICVVWRIYLKLNQKNTIPLMSNKQDYQNCLLFKYCLSGRIWCYFGFLIYIHTQHFFFSYYHYCLLCIFVLSDPDRQHVKVDWQFWFSCLSDVNRMMLFWFLQI